MRKQLKKRRGFTLIEVALSVVIVSVGMMVGARFFSDIYEQLIPNGQLGGLRRYVLSEAMLKAQAEGLRVLRYVPAGSSNCKLVTEPAGSGYTLNVTQNPLLSGPAEELYYFDLTMTQNGQTVGQLSISTLRSTVVAQNEKIGL